MKNEQAFTLIELLVVVLIIGILAAVALPQYQKAVEKSRAAQALTVLKSVVQAAEAYHLANGNYPDKFENMDIAFPNFNKNKAQLISDDVTDTISDDDWSLQIQTGSAEFGPFFNVMMSRISGKYKGASFMLRFAEHASLPTGRILCYERTGDGQTYTLQTPGSYCKNIMKGTQISENTYGIYYEI